MLKMGRAASSLKNAASRPLLRRLALAAAGCLLILSVYQNLVATGRVITASSVAAPVDFDVYYQAGLAVHTGLNPYLSENQLQPGLPFLYPPSSLVFVAGLPIISRDAAFWSLVIANLFCLGWAVYVTLYLFDKPVNTAKLLLITAFAIQTFPFKFNQGMGQVNVIMLALLMTAFWFESRSRGKLTGLLLGLAASIKLFPFLLMPVYLIRKQWLILVSMILTFAVLQLPFLAPAQTFYTSVAPHLSSSQPFTANAHDQSLLTLLGRLWGNQSFNQPLALLIGCGLFAGVLWTGQRRGWRLETNLILMGSVVFLRSPVWQHYLVLVYPWILWKFRHSPWLLFISWAVLAVSWPVQLTRFLPVPDAAVGYLTWGFLALVVVTLWPSIHHSRT
jgi:hypothetical protein